MAGKSFRTAVPPAALVVLAVLVSVIVLSYGETSAWALAGALLAPATAAALLTVAPLVSLCLCVPGALGAALAMRDVVPPWSVTLGLALGVISFLAGRRMPRPVSALAVFAVGATMTVPLGLLAADAWSTGLLVLVLAVAIPWSAGHGLRQQTELAAATAQQVHLRERAGIAHDMHDTLGHELSLLALRAGALEMAPDLDERHRTAVAELRAGAGAATQRLADIVGVLRAGEPALLHPATESIEDLVDRCAGAGLAVKLEWEGPRRLPPLVEGAAHRVVQEALTNAVKHAPGAAVLVGVAVGATATVVTVTSALPLTSRPGAGSRLGLVAVRERVRLVGGSFRAGPREDVFEVAATLPHQGDS